MSRKIMQQALEALDEAVGYVESSAMSPSMANECRDAIYSLRAALAAPQSEPMAWAKRNGIKVVLTTCPPDDLDGWISLYAAPSDKEAGK